MISNTHKHIYKGDGFVITESKPAQTILGTINGPIDEKGIPAFTIQNKVDSAKHKAERLARPENPNAFHQLTTNLDDLIERLNNQNLKPRGLKSVEIKYTTKKVDPNYSGPIALLIPEIHLHGDNNKDDQGEKFLKDNNIAELFETNLELLRALAESRMCKDFVHEGSMQIKNSKPYFDKASAVKQGLPMVAIAGMKGVSVNSGERPETQIDALFSTILQFAVCNKLKEINHDPREMSSESIRIGIENMLLNINQIMKESSELSATEINAEITNKLQAKIEYFHLDKFVKVDPLELKKFSPDSLNVDRDILKLDRDKLDNLIQWLFKEGTMLGAFKRDQDLLETVQSQASGLIPTIVGIKHTPNLVVNELEASGIPVIIASADFHLSEFGIPKSFFDFSQAATRESAKQAQQNLISDAHFAKMNFLSTR